MQNCGQHKILYWLQINTHETSTYTNEIFFIPASAMTTMVGFSNRCEEPIVGMYFNMSSVNVKSKLVAVRK